MNDSSRACERVDTISVFASPGTPIRSAWLRQKMLNIPLQDTEAGAEVMHMAENGFCEHGEQEALIQNGVTRIGGRMPVNTDGEIVTSTPAKFLVHPEAIAVLVPGTPLKGSVLQGGAKA